MRLSLPTLARTLTAPAVTATVLAAALCAPAAQAQTRVSTAPAVPRFGVAFNGLVVIPDGFGVGVRGRAAVPVNADLSVALDLGVNAMGILVGGRNAADYVIDPQVSVVVNLPGMSVGGQRFTYLLAGIGGYFPTGTDANGSDLKGGPTIHAGLGWVVPLNETSVFYEINPALILANSRTSIAIPVRIGLIF